MKIQTKVQTAEAVQWTGDNLQEVLKFTEPFWLEYTVQRDGGLRLPMPRKNLEIPLKDYIVKVDAEYPFFVATEENLKQYYDIVG